jgi:hypothetical protein
VFFEVIDLIGMKCLILVKRSVIIRMLVYIAPSSDLLGGRSITKSTPISSHGYRGIGIGCSKPRG